MPTYTSLPGFRDFYPADFAVRAHITGTWREVARRYGFEEYDGPPLEALELYTDKSGEEIVGQLYNFTDKGGREVALRPEMTPTLARMVGARAGGLRKPVRWFSMPQLFRYERTQRGRLREHFQWNVDVLGEADSAADAEVLAVALDGLRALGLTESHIVARYNDRRLLERLLLQIGVAEEDLPRAYNAVDKLGRDPDERIRDRLRDEAGLAADAIERVFRVFRAGSLDALRAEFGSIEGVGEEIERIAQFQQRLEAMGFGDFVAYDASIVRGLAYYTGIVFEIFDRRGELRAICGGGRYDRLLGAVSGSELPAVGFGMGDVVLAELLRDLDLLPDTAPSVDVYLVAVTDAEQPTMLRAAHALRRSGRSVLYALRATGVGKQFKDADARGAKRVIVFGPDEVAAGVAVVRTMGTGGEERVALERILAGELDEPSG
ncbi:MAG: histidine--tRNA ligase [Longimicrobiales bacterium]